MTPLTALLGQRIRLTCACGNSWEMAVNGLMPRMPMASVEDVCAGAVCPACGESGSCSWVVAPRSQP